MISLISLPVLLLPLTTSSAQDTIASMHPDDAVFYIEMPDLPAMVGAYEQTALVQLLNNKDVAGVVAPLMGEDPATFNLLTMGLEQAIANMPPIAGSFIPMAGKVRSLSISATTSGKDLAAWSAEHAPGSEEWSKAIGAQVMLTFDNEAMASALYDSATPLLKGLGEVSEILVSPEAGGHSLHVQMPGSPPMAIIQNRTNVAVVFGACAGASYADTIKRLSGKNLSLKTVAGKALANDLATDGGVLVFDCYSNIHSDALATFAEDMPFGPTIDVIEAAMGPLAAIFTRGGHWTMSLHDGRFVTHGLVPSGGVHGVFSDEPVGSRASSLLHPAAALAFATSIDREALTDLVALALAESGAEGQLEQLDKQFQFRPDRDLLAMLGGSIGVSIPPLKSMMSAPTVLALADLEDAAGFTAGMRKLKAVLDTMEEGVTLSETEYRGRAIFTFAMEVDNAPSGGLPFNPAAMIKPTLAVLDGKVLIGLAQMQVKKEVRRQAKIEDGPSPILDGYDVPAGSSQVVYADWGTFVGKIYSSLKAMAPMLAMGGELPFDPDGLPSAEIFTDFFKPTVRYELPGKDGTSYVEWSSLGPELALILGVGIVMPRATMLAGGGQIPPPVMRAPIEEIREQAPTIVPGDEHLHEGGGEQSHGGESGEGGGEHGGGSPH
ncbi:MAG: hypothetical protein ACI841_005302 [Planctomycetota bacterium]|jgi:hypothetical protein